jgi:acetyl-CoA/propionyl-CoA/long-chain acyl-CoA carboxylase, biotin carboxylase, biotin carboxyl carrier protein
MAFRKVLVANRGEIALRIVRTLHELGIASVAVYSDADAEAPHVRLADEAVRIGPGQVGKSYLDMDAILEAARSTGADAIHPGYGFFAEHAGFARACARADCVFIGPPPEAIESMGVKTTARRLMEEAGVPVVPGTITPLGSPAEALATARSLGFPVAFKTAGGGGGKGFHVAFSEEEAATAFERAATEGERFFANADVYVEEYLEDPRHVEVQILADGHGNVVHLGERDCSIQRRHQKLVEESPGPTVTPALRERICAIAVEAAHAVGYRGAGTVEGLLVGKRFFFLEMNTRLQVEHPVTEMVTGIDIVREQVRIAAGEPLSFAQADVVFRGHAIECRVNAESAHLGFVPLPGAITRYEEPGGPGVRVDSGVFAGWTVPPFYDSLLAKLIVWDETRESATSRMLRALAEFHVEGVATLIPFHRALLASPQWARGETARDLLGDADWLAGTAPPDEKL